MISILAVEQNLVSQLIPFYLIQYLQLSVQLPKDLKYKTITFFYKDKTFKKCFKDDYKLTDIPIRQENEMLINNFLSSINNNPEILYIIDKNNSSSLKLNEINFLKLRNL